MNDYDRIAEAIRFIRNNVGKQPGLEEVATHVHLSTFHFQRLFSRWAGVTPKRFLQILTLERAKALLKEQNISVLDVANTIGLSSGSRLYDHFVQIEAVTPSEYKQAGLGLTIQFGIHETPFGNAFIATTTRGICRLIFIDKETKPDLVQQLQHEWPLAELLDDPVKTASVIKKLFYCEDSPKRPLSLLVRGTNFQINVWQALLNIPEGKIACYGDIAKAIDKPKAARAVGTAIGANPIAFIIPCHRVIQQNGQLGGYRWGETRKHAILAREAALHE